MIYIFKGMLIVFVVSAAIIALVLYCSLLCREWHLDIRARRSRQGTLLLNQPIVREYTGKDHPAWQRQLEFAQGRALAAKLRMLGE